MYISHAITACVLIAEAASKPLKHIRTVSDPPRVNFRELVAWLREFGVEHVAMESTGVYGNLCGTYLKVTFRSCWPTRSTSRRFPGASGYEGLSVDS